MELDLVRAIVRDRERQESSPIVCISEIGADVVRAVRARCETSDFRRRRLDLEVGCAVLQILADGCRGRHGQIGDDQRAAAGELCSESARHQLCESRRGGIGMGCGCIRRRASRGSASRGSASKRMVLVMHDRV